MLFRSVSTEVAEVMDAGRRKAENLSHERRRHWDGREFDEYIVAAEGLLPCQYTPEDLTCQQETLDEIFSVLDTCTPTQRERFLLFALDGYNYTSLAALPPSSVKNILYGRSQDPKILTIKKICDGLDITLIDFFNSPEFASLELEIK